MDSYSCKSPVLFLVFNRPDVTKRVFEAIRQARPPRLYVAADGAREDREGEDQLVEETRRIATAVDWDCKVITLFREENLGCGRAVSEGITWFFENEPEGIILEDDCLPISDFFRFCDLGLERFSDESRIAQICGLKRCGNIDFAPYSNCYMNFGSIWGWASWRRAWATYSFNPSTIKYSASDCRSLRKEGVTAKAALFLEKKLQLISDGALDTWDYQWTAVKLKNRHLSVVPNCNLIVNIGFGDDATHTKKINPHNRFEHTPFKNEIIFQPQVEPCQQYNLQFCRHNETLGLLPRIWRKLGLD